ncbi:hypothetical protein J6590_106228, partial [Homalodisca vitripennis]
IETPQVRFAQYSTAVVSIYTRIFALSRAYLTVALARQVSVVNERLQDIETPQVRFAQYSTAVVSICTRIFALSRAFLTVALASQVSVVNERLQDVTQKLIIAIADRDTTSQTRSVFHCSSVHLYSCIRSLSRAYLTVALARHVSVVNDRLQDVTQKLIIAIADRDTTSQVRSVFHCSSVHLYSYIRSLSCILDRGSETSRCDKKLIIAIADRDTTSQTRSVFHCSSVHLYSYIRSLSCILDRDSGTPSIETPQVRHAQYSTAVVSIYTRIFALSRAYLTVALVLQVSVVNERLQDTETPQVRFAQYSTAVMSIYTRIFALSRAYLTVALVLHVSVVNDRLQNIETPQVRFAQYSTAVVSIYTRIFALSRAYLTVALVLQVYVVNERLQDIETPQVRHAQYSTAVVSIYTRIFALSSAFLTLTLVLQVSVVNERLQDIETPQVRHAQYSTAVVSIYTRIFALSRAYLTVALVLHVSVVNERLQDVTKNRDTTSQVRSVFHCSSVHLYSCIRSLSRAYLTVALARHVSVVNDRLQDVTQKLIIAIADRDTTSQVRSVFHCSSVHLYSYIRSLSRAYLTVSLARHVSVVNERLQDIETPQVRFAQYSTAVVSICTRIFALSRAFLTVALASHVSVVNERLQDVTQKLIIAIADRDTTSQTRSVFHCSSVHLYSCIRSLSRAYLTVALARHVSVVNDRLQDVTQKLIIAIADRDTTSQVRSVFHCSSVHLYSYIRSLSCILDRGSGTPSIETPQVRHAQYSTAVVSIYTRIFALSRAFLTVALVLQVSVVNERLQDVTQKLIIAIADRDTTIVSIYTRIFALSRAYLTVALVLQVSVVNERLQDIETPQVRHAQYSTAVVSIYTRIFALSRAFLTVTLVLQVYVVNERLQDVTQKLIIAIADRDTTSQVRSVFHCSSVHLYSYIRSLSLGHT